LLTHETADDDGDGDEDEDEGSDSEDSDDDADFGECRQVSVVLSERAE
jgi:hypothetical protein